MTPLMRQYHAIKQNYADALVLFQVGDFYELFFEDAQKASSFLGIALTARGTQDGKPIPLCGVPVHTVDHYLVKLVKGGFRVALCDQLTQAVPGKVVERGVTQVLTPGTLTDPKLLSDKAASYIAALFPQGEMVGLAFAELLTGQLYVTACMVEDERLLEAECARFAPDEIIVPATALGARYEKIVRSFGYVTTTCDVAQLADCIELMKQSWLASVHEQAPLLERLPASIAASALLYSYLAKNQERAVGYIRHVAAYAPEDFLIMDAATQRNLEIIKNTYDGSTECTLFSVVDRATTAMGSRTIRKWLMRPLVKKELIEYRFDAVQVLMHAVMEHEQLADLLQKCGDLERTVGRIALRRAQMHDYKNLIQGLSVIPAIKKVLARFTHVSLMRSLYEKCEDFYELTDLLARALYVSGEKEWKIAEGYHPELDRLRLLVDQGADAVAHLEAQEQKRTGIASLKIRNHAVYGYAVEITKTHIDSIPADYIRLQTLVNRERYTFQALRDLEYDISRARSDSEQLESELYNEIRIQVESALLSLRKASSALAHLDALLSFARISYAYGYVRPVFSEKSEIIIQEGRHPVVAALLGHAFIPNDTLLNDEQRMWIITGPNMGGKSTYLRQVALFQILAQSGCFVPAQRALLALLDRIFTRIGAADNVAEGKSTFLVEMEETALICNQATARSLVILDEVGRGTSTHDGLAIAQAVVEYIYTTVRALCLFATHYHELTALCGHYSGVVAYHAASEQKDDAIVLLHKIVQGVARGSFGIEVARKAHIPTQIIMRAQVLLTQLHEKARLQNMADKDSVKLLEDTIIQLQQQVSQYKKVVGKIQAIDFDVLSPKQALDVLWECKENGLL